MKILDISYLARLGHSITLLFKSSLRIELQGFINVTEEVYKQK
jgi:hypothetical protein